jgi:hypothetical protein
VALEVQKFEEAHQSKQDVLDILGVSRVFPEVEQFNCDCGAASDPYVLNYGFSFYQ